MGAAGEAGPGFQAGQAVEATIRRAAVLLAGWCATSLADILEMETAEFWAWFAEAQTVQNEIAKELKR